MGMNIELPIDRSLNAIGASLNEARVLILEAPPGTGKTTRVPAYLAFELGLRTIVLEPRRIAARQAALRVANERGVVHGVEVGHAFRYESKWGAQTKLLYATEGTFLRMLQSRDFNFDVVILDEFHERHLDSDLALALLSQRREKIVVMSATMKGLELKAYFDELQISARELKVESPLFACSMRYLENRPEVLNRSLALKVLSVFEEALSFGGDILIFLPGVREINEIEQLLSERYENLTLIQLHGKLEMSEQARAFTSSVNKKIILATNVAESSLTVPGVRVVIDSGLAREQSWSAWTGLSVLTDVKIPQSSAIQRAGRAAREGEGLCLRLYSEHDFNSRPKAARSELSRSALDDVRLRLSTMKAPYVWFEKPASTAWNDAGQKLRLLGAFGDDEQTPTETGIEMAQIPLPPSWARVALEARRCDQKSREALYQLISSSVGESYQAVKSRLEKILGTPGSVSECLERLLLPGFVHALAKLRAPPQSDLITATGRTLKLGANIVRDLSGDEWGLVFDADQSGRVHRFFAIDTDWLYELEPLPFVDKKALSWHESRGLMLSDSLSIGSLVVEESSRAIKLEDVSHELMDQARSLLFKHKEKKLNELKQSQRWARLFTGHSLKPCRDLSLDDLVAEYLTNEGELESESFFSFLELKSSELWGAQFDKLLPWKIGELQITYELESPPFMAALIQYFYGLKETPKLPLTQQALTLKILGPHKRAVQMTNDLAGFWQRGYVELLKEMRREYPRHHWPDDPASAPAILLKRQLNL